MLTGVGMDGEPRDRLTPTAATSRGNILADVYETTAASLTAIDAAVVERRAVVDEAEQC